MMQTHSAEVLTQGLFRLVEGISPALTSGRGTIWVTWSATSSASKVRMVRLNARFLTNEI